MNDRGEAAQAGIVDHVTLTVLCLLSSGAYLKSSAASRSNNCTAAHSHHSH